MGLLGVASFTVTAVLFVACGGGSGDTSTFDDAGIEPPDGNLDASLSLPDGGDATTPIFTLRDSSTTGNGDGNVTIDCDATPLACIPEICGDGKIEPGETCDDGNSTSGDGCSSSCQLEGDYYACVAGQACVDTRNCEELAEAGLIKAGSDSGCSAPPKAAVCGDGYLDIGEACDTGADNGKATSGCAADCSSIFAGYVCPTAGVDCTNTWICGDGKIEGTEQCDEGKAKTAGCTAADAGAPTSLDAGADAGDAGATLGPCQVVAGWTCTIPGTACVAAKCGDGIIAGNEQCDVGPTPPLVNGCTACRLSAVTTSVAADAGVQPSTVITNYNCSYPDGGTPDGGIKEETCAPTVCGNGIKEGTEQCDDGNTKGYDGCSAQCQLEPSCLNNVDATGKAIPDGTCVSICGDGIVFDFDSNGDGKQDEQCDDGNTLAGDGCSPTCQAEPGYSCTISTPAAATYIDVPIVYHDMLYAGTSFTTTAPGTKDAKNYAHPDFEYYSNANPTPGLNKVALVNGVPVFEWDGEHDPKSGKATGVDSTVTPNSVNPGGAASPQLTVFTPSGTTTDYSKSVDYTDWFADVLDPRKAGLEAPRGLRVDNLSVRMVLQSNGSYVFDSNCDQPYGAGYDTSGNCITVTNTIYSTNDKKTETQQQYGGLGGFYPLDGKGWNAILATPQTDYDQWQVWSGKGTTNNPVHAAHNFSFTTHFRYYFTYVAAGPRPPSPSAVTTTSGCSSPTSGCSISVVCTRGRPATSLSTPRWPAPWV